MDFLAPTSFRFLRPCCIGVLALELPKRSLPLFPRVSLTGFLFLRINDPEQYTTTVGTIILTLQTMNLGHREVLALFGFSQLDQHLSQVKASEILRTPCSAGCLLFRL